MKFRKRQFQLDKPFDEVDEAREPQRGTLP
jgi:hypothetical protein